MSEMKQVIADHYGPQTAASYDQICDSLFWAYTATIENMVASALFAFPDKAKQDSWRICDLGAGTGNLSARLAEAITGFARLEGQSPSIDLTLCDQSMPMMEQANAKLARFPNVRSRNLVRSFTDVLADRSEEKFDVIMSSFAVHHLDEEGKAALIKVAFDKLKPGGVLVIGDRMMTDGETGGVPDETALRIVASRFHPLMKNQGQDWSLMRTAEFVQREFDRDGDRPSSREHHLAWMRMAGFEKVMAPFQSFGCCVVSGRKPMIR